MKVGSLFTGVGGMDLGLERAGMECVFQVENDKHCIEVLEQRWPLSGCRMSETSDGVTCHCAMCLSGASPVKGCPSPGSVEVYPTNEADSSGSLFELHASCVPPGWYSKTYPDYCPRTTDGTWAPSSGGWKTQGIAAHGECWTRSGSESPRDAVVSSLSDILTPDVPERFYLSRRAARGILRRCEKRGRTLPETLRLALIRLATTEDSEPNQANTLSPTIPSGQTATAKPDTRLNPKQPGPYKPMATEQPGTGREPSSPTPSGETPTTPARDQRILSPLPCSPATGKDATPNEARGHLSVSTGRAAASAGPTQRTNRTPLDVKDGRPLLVRRLTPVETEILQGFPEGWTVDGIGKRGTQ